MTRRPVPADVAPLSPEERKGFGPAVRKPKKTLRPFVKVSGPSKEDGPKGYTVFIGVKGTF